MLIGKRRVKWISNSDYKELEPDGIEIASMIKGLINSLKNHNITLNLFGVSYFFKTFS